MSLLHGEIEQLESFACALLGSEKILKARTLLSVVPDPHHLRHSLINNIYHHIRLQVWRAGHIIFSNNSSRDGNMPNQFSIRNTLGMLRIKERERFIHDAHDNSRMPLSRQQIG